MSSCFATICKFTIVSAPSTTSKSKNPNLHRHHLTNPNISESVDADRKKMKETRKLKKRILHDEETNGKRVEKKNQRKKKAKVSNVDLSEHPQDSPLQAISSEKPKRNVELKKKSKIIKSSSDDGKLSCEMKKINEKGSNVDISEPNLEANSNEKVKGKKGKMNKTKKKRKAEDISSASVEDDHLKREGKSKKSNKKKKMKVSSMKVNKVEEEEDVYQISSGEEDCTRGMKKWVTEYYESRSDLDELQKRIDDFMTAHEERLEKEKQDRETKAAEGGWTVVVHHKGRKKTTETETGTAVGSVSQAALEDKVAKKKETIAHGFYRFQRREAQQNKILELQSKFEQDKKRIQQLRAARRFKPF